ncbi:MAG TPA: site-2 protease family protein [Candidatus Dormibacteraeota bacterium]|nr:site-2 protease family protein [Candidatus Dormibacteraeota bacterium]
MPSFEPNVIALGFIWYIVFLLSTTCHEASHALAAKWGGDLTAFHGGQVTLNPVPHIQRSPFGMIGMPLLSFILTKGSWMMGWASAPFDPYWQRRHYRRAAWMAFAGPAANFTLMLFAALAIRVGMAMGQFQVPGTVSFDHVTQATVPGSSAEFAATFLSILFVLNLLLGTFNLLPVPPLDGSTGITLFMDEKTALKYLDWLSEGSYAFVGLMIAWLVFGKIFSTIFLLAINVLYPTASYGLH